MCVLCYYMYVSAYYLMCVLMLLYMCPHTTVYVPSCYYICALCYYMCVFILLYVSLYYYICVLILLYMCPLLLYVCFYTTICVLILLYMCPHTSIYVSSYCECLNRRCCCRRTLHPRVHGPQARSRKGHAPIWCGPGGHRSGERPY